MPDRKFKIGDQVGTIPEKNVAAFLAKYPNAIEVSGSKQSFFERVKELSQVVPVGQDVIPQMKFGAFISGIGRAIGEDVAERVVPNLLTVPSLQRGAPPAVEKSPEASMVAKEIVALGADPVNWIPLGIATKTKRLVKPIQEIAEAAAKKAKPLEKIAEVRVVSKNKIIQDTYEKILKELPADISKDINISAIKVGKFPLESAGEKGRLVIGAKDKHFIVIEEGVSDIAETMKHELLHSYVLEHPELTAKYGYFGHEKAIREIEAGISKPLEKIAEGVKPQNKGIFYVGDVIEYNGRKYVVDNVKSIADIQLERKVEGSLSYIEEGISPGKYNEISSKLMNDPRGRSYDLIAENFKKGDPASVRLDTPGRDIMDAPFVGRYENYGQINKPQTFTSYAKQAEFQEEMATKPLEKIAEGVKPLDDIERLGQSALRRDPLFESIIRKDPEMIAARRGIGVSNEKVGELAPKLTGEEAVFLDRTLNTGGAFVGRKAAIEVTENIKVVVNKAIGGEVDPRISDILGIRAERGRGLQNIKADNDFIVDVTKKLAADMKASDPELYKKMLPELEKALAPVLGEGAIKMTTAQKIIRYSAEIGNIPRSFMTSADLSMGLRQGIWVATSHPKIFFKAWAKQFKMFGSENYFQAIQKEMRSRPNFRKAQKAGLDFTDLDDITKREESFQSNFAEAINLPFGPKGARFKKGIGPGMIVRASGRAFTGLSNRLRMDMFDYMLDYATKQGIKHSDDYLKSVGKYLNDATGRGTLPKFLEGSAVVLNTTLFSPRLLFSRLNLLNPYKYYKMDPTVRKEALKSLFKFAGMATAVTGLAKMGGAEVETDPRNANFMKIKVGNTRYDPLGGFQQPIRAAAQIISKKVISSTTGKEIELGEGYKPLTQLAVAARFLAMKESPLVSFAHGLMEGKNAIGEKFDIPTEIANRFTPMVAQDMRDLINEGGLDLNTIVGTSVATFGVGVQTYGGVQTWGLKGTEYPNLNKELLRLKTTMGFPSSSAFGQEFSNAEYKRFKNVAGKRIARELSSLISSAEYQGYSDADKTTLIGKYIDQTKKVVKLELYGNKRSE